MNILLSTPKSVIIRSKLDTTKSKSRELRYIRFFHCLENDFIDYQIIKSYLYTNPINNDFRTIEQDVLM